MCLLIFHFSPPANSDAAGVCDITSIRSELSALRSELKAKIPCVPASGMSNPFFYKGSKNEQLILNLIGVKLPENKKLWNTTHIIVKISITAIVSKSVI